MASSPPARLDASLLVRKTEIDAEVKPPVPVEDAPRLPFSCRLLKPVIERLSEVSHRSKLSKQAVVEAALLEYFERRESKNE